MRNPRKRYVCIDCGLRLDGRMAKDGRVYAYDRCATDTTTPPQPCVCMQCAERQAEVEA